MTFYGSSEGSWTLGRPGPEDCWALGVALGDGEAASAGVAAARAISSTGAAAPASTRLGTRTIEAELLPDEAGRQVDDGPRQETQDHADDGSDHQGLAPLLAADGALGQVEAGAEDEGQDADGEQETLDPARDPVEGGVDLLSRRE